MIKDHYLEELKISRTQSIRANTNNKPDVLKIQSWLCLQAISDPSLKTTVNIDGDFGPLTEKAVMRFQQVNKLTANGIVDTETFSLLCKPMTHAFTHRSSEKDARKLIVQIAKQHLAAKACELTINGQTNSGPWVRAYMDGYDGSKWLWCMGFAQTVIDQAASLLGLDFSTVIPHTYSCDVLANFGKNNGLFLPYTFVRKEPLSVWPGDIFIVQKTKKDWIHTGIITDIDDENGTFETIEGNTNTDGSANGTKVCLRARSFMQQKSDLYSIQPLAMGL